MSIPIAYRQEWGDLHGWCKLDLTWPEVTCESIILATASEYEADEHGRGYQCNHYGDARYTVHNICPYDGGVIVRLEIDWPDPLATRVDYILMNP